MTDVTQLTAENEALKSESASLKDVISRYESQCMALDQTVKEVLTANISFKAGAHMMEKKINSINSDSSQKDETIKMLNDQLSSARTEIESLSSQLNALLA
jgi:predicted RNase H-like nuclease (RuvC/YqgF family)